MKDSLTSNQYLARKAQLEKDRCDRCVGLGQLTDGEPGDTYFNEWRCPECRGSGLKSAAVETTWQTAT